MKRTTRLFIVTLEPIDKRYTKQWYETWRPKFKKYFDVVDYIDGRTITDKIEKGRFLDVNQTNMWKAVQVEKLSMMFYKNIVEKGDIFLFMDGWHFGITALKYMAQLNNIPVKIYAYWHAGTYDKHDFISQAGLDKWAKFNEMGWFKGLDGSFVATKFHKRLIMKMFKKEKKYINTNKIKIVGFPMNWEEVISNELSKKKSIFKDLPRLKTVVFPHRIDKEKCPEVFDKLAKKFPKYKFIKTIEVTKNKKEYYNLLRNSRVSFSASKQETFGIGTVEAMMLGCIPLVPRRLSYTELYDGLFIYSSLRIAKQKLKRFVENYNNKKIQQILKQNQQKIQRISQQTYKKMSDIMLQ